jgi:hypothetical protein
MVTVKIPKTPRSAYNPDRNASDLLTAHIRNLEKAVGKRTKGKAAITPKPLTEGEAAAYIRQLGRELHQATLLPLVTAAPTIDQRPPAAAKPASGRQTSATSSRGKKATPSRRKKGALAKRRTRVRKGGHR